MAEPVRAVRTENYLKLLSSVHQANSRLIAKICKVIREVMELHTEISKKENRFWQENIVPYISSSYQFLSHIQ